MARWHAPHAKGFVWQPLGDAVALFDTHSGRTHFLTPAAAGALRRLDAGPAGFDALLEAAAEEDADADPAELRESLATTLHDLELLSLVEPCIG